MKRVWIVLVLSGALCCLLLWHLPATLFGTFVNRACGDECRLIARAGAFWRGQGTLYARSRAGGRWITLGSLDWRFGLREGNWSPQLALELNGGALWVQGTLFGWEAKADRLKLPAQVVLARVGHGLPNAGWGGVLYFERGQYSEGWEGRSPSGQGRVYWLRARTAALSDRKLGDYRFDWRSRPTKKMQVRIVSEPGDGVLKLTGEARVQAQDFHFKGDAEVSRTDETALISMLGTVGRPLVSEGRTRRFSLQWPR